jgi:formate/nitrite transporter FocA (FNT family)
MLSGLLLEDAVLHNATKKIHNPYDKMFFLGTLAGIWVGFGGLAAVSAAGGVPEDVRARWVMLPKLLMGSFFAFGSFFSTVIASYPQSSDLYTSHSSPLDYYVRRRTVHWEYHDSFHRYVLQVSNP